ncbi:Fic family protein, partial [Candidatus Shapirobacteria bacterium CG10_big_fil_rev_8_21_14_0_10_38_8]
MNDKLQEKLKTLTEKKKELDKQKPLTAEVLKNLEGWLKVELTYSSNAIEGNTLTRLETAEVIEKGISAALTGKSLQDQLEAINHAKAVEFIKTLAKEEKSHQFITEQDIKAIHKIILTG